MFLMHLDRWPSYLFSFHSQAKTCFLEIMEPLSSTSSSSFSSCTSNIHILPIGEAKWQMGEKTIQQILSVIQPTADSENRRKEIIEYISELIEDSFGIKVFPFGSVPLKTYLPHGDVDLTVVSHYDTSQDLAAKICSFLQNEEKSNSRIQVRDVLCIPAQVRVIKCTAGNISVDISCNQTAGLFALCFLEQVDHFIARDHLFKRSVILIKAWCYYESRLLGGFHGLISTYALETMVFHVINHFHSSLHCPLAVLYKFLEYYSTFNWEKFCVGINGLVLISSFPEIVVEPPHSCDELLLPDDFLRSFRYALLSSAGILGTLELAFPVKFLNIMDPLRDDNNLGRSVSKGNFYRIKSALSYGSQTLGDIMMLPREKISKGLEKIFANTLERNGRGGRVDVLVPVPTYGAGSSESSGANGDLLAGIQYGLWFHEYGISYTHPSATHPGWSNGRGELGQNVHRQQNIYWNINGSPSYPVHTMTSLWLTGIASIDEKGKSRGTGPYIPNLEYLLQRDVSCEESREEVETVDSRACTPSPREADTFSDVGENGCVFDFSMKEFPLLPGSKPKSVKLSQLRFPKCDQVKEIVASFDSLEFGSFKYSSPRSVTLSEPGKLSDSDDSVILDSPRDSTLTAQEDRESLKNEEKVAILMQQPLQLTNENEFPPLNRPIKPEIRLDKKEFPPLRSFRSKWKKNSKEVQKGNRIR